jgi:hypothetical protein
LGAEKEITTAGNNFNGPSQLVQMDAQQKVPVSATQTFVHNQLVSSSSWVVSHGMNKRPSVQVVSNTGDAVVGDVSYVDDNNLVINFVAAFGGKAYLN